MLLLLAYSRRRRKIRFPLDSTELRGWALLCLTALNMNRPWCSWSATLVCRNMMRRLCRLPCWSAKSFQRHVYSKSFQCDRLERNFSMQPLHRLLDIGKSYKLMAHLLHQERIVRHGDCRRHLLEELSLTHRMYTQKTDNRFRTCNRQLSAATTTNFACRLLEAIGACCIEE